MKKIYSIELKRAFLSNRMAISLVIGLAICVCHLIQWIPGAYSRLIVENATGDMTFIPESVFGNWIGANEYTWEQFVYFLLVPLLASIPYSSSLYDDCKNGCAKNYMLRNNKIDYLRAKALAVFLSGGTAVVVPLVINFMICMLFLPLIDPELTTNIYTIMKDSMLSPFYYNHTYLYLLIYLLLDFVYAGMFATMSILFTNVAEHRYIVEMVPVVVYVFLFAVSELVDKPGISPSNFLNPACSRPDLLVIILLAFISLIIECMYIEYVGRRGEIY